MKVIEKNKESFYFKVNDGYFLKEKEWIFLPFEKSFNSSRLIEIANKLKDLNSKN